MIFATVGTQLPFDRLVKALDDWASEHKHTEVFAQIGCSNYRPRTLKHERFLKPSGFKHYLDKATLIVAHAGIGSILSALEIGKPVLVLPRQAEFREHRNDHQLATAKRFESMDLVWVAADAEQLKRHINAITKSGVGQQASQMPKSDRLVRHLRDFITSPKGVAV